MSSKLVEFSREARASLLDGVQQLAHVVKVTLGPGGHNVAIERKWGAPLITRDGVTVAREVELPNKFQNAAVQLLKEAIFVESLHHIEAGANPIALQRGIQKAVDAVQKDLQKSAKPVSGKNDLEYVATVAAGNDPEIGKIIADAIDMVGKDGAVTVEEARGIDTKITRIEGMQFDKGYMSPHFVNRPEKLTCELDKPYILVHEKKIANANALIPILEKVAPTKRPLLIIADELEAEALALLVVNRIQGVFISCAVKAPGFGDGRKELLEDIAVFTGAKALLEDIGVPLEEVTLKDLGTAKKVIIEKEATTIVEGAGSDEAIQGRIQLIKNAITLASSDYDREKLQSRSSKLSGGLAQIDVGAATEIEMKQKRARLEDALHAARAAVEEGVLPGGGVALLRSRRAVDALKLSGDEKIGAQILRRALEMPIRQIADNAGDRGSVVVQKIEESKDYNFGFDAQEREYKDMIKGGILDPRKVVRLALQNAASMAGIFMTTEAVITEKPEPKVVDNIPSGMGDGPNPGMPSMPGMMPGMGGMGM
jgi:chaperonin GroEL